MKLPNFLRKLFKIKTHEEMIEWEKDRDYFTKYFRVTLKFWNALVALQDRGFSLVNLFSDDNGNKPEVTSRDFPYFDISINVYFKGATVRLTRYHDEKLIKKYQLPEDCHDDGWVVACRSCISGITLNSTDQMRLIDKIAAYLNDKVKQVEEEADQKIKELLS